MLTLNVFAPTALAQTRRPRPPTRASSRGRLRRAGRSAARRQSARGTHQPPETGRRRRPAAAPTTPEESTPATLSDSLNSLAQEGIGTFNQKLGALQS
ncbi:hypothetical protein M5585_22700 [Serratia ureilytica]